MNPAASENNISYDLTDLRYWFRSASFRHLFVSMVMLLGASIAVLSHPGQADLLYAFGFAIISSILTFLSYYVFSSSKIHRLYAEKNVDSLAFYRTLEYSITAPLSFIAYLFLLPIENPLFYFYFYILAVLNIHFSESIEVAKNHHKIALSNFLSFVSLGLTLVLFIPFTVILFEMPFQGNEILYIWYCLYIITRFRYYPIFVTHKPGSKRFAVLEPNFVNADLTDRILLAAGLIIYGITL